MVGISEIEERVEKIWRNKVRKDVDNWRDIENESELHASLYYWLRYEFRNDDSIRIAFEDCAVIPNRIVDLVLYSYNRPVLYFELKCKQKEMIKSKFRSDLKKLKELSKNPRTRGYIFWVVSSDYSRKDEKDDLSKNLIKILEEKNTGFFSKNLKWRQGFLREAIGVRRGKRKHWKIRYFERSGIVSNKYTS